MPSLPELLLAKALAFHQAELDDDSGTACRQALALAPDLGPAWTLAGALALAGGQPAVALIAARAAVALIAAQAAVALIADAGACYILGNALWAAERVADADAAWRAALALAPDDPRAWDNHGNAALRLGDTDDALAAFERARALAPERPESHWNRAVALLVAGRWSEGWAAYEWRFRAVPGLHDRALGERYRGGPVAGRTVFVWHEQGYGDFLQFLRYVVALRQAGARVLLECPAPMRPLLAGWPVVADLVDSGEWPPPFDLHVPLMSLPAVLGGECLRAGLVPYLPRPDAARLTLPADGRPLVGLVWAGRQIPGNLRRSCRPADLLPLLARPGLNFVSLQREATASELAPLLDRGVTHLGEAINDFADLAAAIGQLDLLLTIDSAPAHLAGALGRPVWTMLSDRPDWRFPPHRRDNPWYPGMRLFRQPRPGDWAAVVAEVVAELDHWPLRRLP